MWGFITSTLSAIFGPPSPQSFSRRVPAPPTYYYPSHLDSPEPCSNKQTYHGRPSPQDDSDAGETFSSTTDTVSVSEDECDSVNEYMTSEAQQTRREYLLKFGALQRQERTHEANESDKLESKAWLSRSPLVSYGGIETIDADAMMTITFKMQRNSLYEPAKGDLVLLYQKRPTIPTGKRSEEGLYGEVTLVKFNEFNVEVNAKACQRQMGPQSHYICNEWFIKPTINEVFHRRCFKAFSELGSRSCSIFQVILGVARPTVNLPKPSQASSLPCVYLDDSIYGLRNPLETKLQKDPQLNPAQELAITRALTSNIALIQGPPGTGKTCTIVQLIKRLSLSIGQATGKILCVTPSNAASDHLAICLLKAGLIVYRPRSKGGLRRIATSNPELYKIGCGARAVRDFSLPPRKFSKKARSGACAMADVVCATCCTAGGDVVASHRFRFLIVDEAAQATEPEILIPFSSGSITRLILVGDHKQLGPTVKSERGQSELAISLFERLCKRGVRTSMLNEQFRMHRSLSLFSSRQFYAGKLKTAASVANRHLEYHAVYSDPMKLIDVPNGKETDEKLSKANSNEAQAVINEITFLTTYGIKPQSIKVITPYLGQRDLIKSKLAPNHQKLIHVGSVDSMQGSESDIIIVSTVRSNMENAIGFVKDPRRMNVTLTRAKYKLILVCNVQTLSSNRLWRDYLSDFQKASKVSRQDQGTKMSNKKKKSQEYFKNKKYYKKKNNPKLDQVD